MGDWIEDVTPWNLCPQCGYASDRATGPDDGPSQGALAICLNCGAINRFTQDLHLEATTITPDELALPHRAAIAYIKRRGPLPAGRSTQ